MSGSVRCISVALRPGRLGMAMHNAGYRALDLPFSYEAIASEEIAPVIEMVRREGIRGCSVTMPFKEQVIAHLDALSPVAAQVGAVNTVVNTDGRLVGHNTDATGFAAALARLELPSGARIEVLGAGGAARAALWALRSIGLTSVQVTARRPEQAEAVAAQYAIPALAWEERGREAEAVINATPIGMAPDEGQTPLDLNTTPKLRTVVDLVANPPLTRLLRAGQERGLQILGGVQVTLEQALDQFTLYTGRPAPREEMARALDELVFPNQQAQAT